MTKLRAHHIVWDWNGTLLDDNHAVLAGVNSACEKYGRVALTLDEWRAIFSRPLVACYERVLNRPLTANDWDIIDRCYQETYRQAVDTCALASGIPDALHRWRAAGRTQSVLSMWSHDELVPLLAKLNLSDLFARVDGLRGYNLGGSKTEYLIDHLATQQLDPANVVLIGDVTDDAEAAMKAGAQCVLVSTGVMSRARLELVGVPVVDSIPEALAMIET